MLAKKLMGATAAKKPLYVDDVFSTHLYTGNGATQTINNGIDLAGEGGLVWTKTRTASYGHFLIDTARGVNQRIQSNTTDAQVFTPNGLNSFNADGYSLGTNAGYNYSGGPFVSWTFRRAPKFFDIVTYTGGTSSSPTPVIPHNLGAPPALIIVKSLHRAASWRVCFNSGTTKLWGYLNTTDALMPGKTFNLTDTTLSPAGWSSAENGFNSEGGQYVAYLFARDDSEDGIIQCGSYIGNGSSTGPTVTLGWEPQYLMIKNASGTGNWQIIDSMRGMPVGSADATLQANLENAESAVDYVSPTATGFQITSTSGEVNDNGATYIYLAIRRPNKLPKSGSEVYNAIARAGTGAATTIESNFTADLLHVQRRNDTTYPIFLSRLTGDKFLYSNTISTESTQTTFFPANPWDVQKGVRVATNIPVNATFNNYINHFFRRAPGFFDVVCDTGTGAAHAINHNLTVAPELIIRKSRSAATQWEVWHSALTASEKLVLNSNEAKATDATAWNSTAPGTSSFTVGTGANVNANGAAFVTYLFATLPGISKVGSYTGNGTTQTIPCGFTTGSRFILIKRTDAEGDWYVWDSARGITSGNDPHLSLNTQATEVYDDSVDPAPEGFIVNQVAATNINVSGGQYIFLAIS